MRASYRFLEIADQHQEMRPLLRDFVNEIRKMTGCDAVGIRLDEDVGYLPFRVAAGLRPGLRDLEHLRTVESDGCLCLNIVKGKGDLGTAVAPGGTFHRNRLSRFIADLNPDQRGRVRAICPFFDYETMALIPIRTGKKILGVIHVVDRKPDRLTTRMLGLLEYTAMPLGGAIQRIMSQEKLWKLYARLEDRVQERTRALTASNEQLRREIEERNRAREALKESENKLRFLTTQLLSAQEKERKRISIELHDELGQALLTLKLQLRALENRLGDDQDELRGDFQLVFRHINSITEDVRRLSRDLSPSILEDLGLVAALRWLTKQLGKHHYIDIACDIDDLQGCFDSRKELIVFRIFQEALTNVVKHARSRRARIAARRLKGRMEFVIEDHGEGFDTARVLKRVAGDRGLGLTAMDERVRMLGGRLEVRSAEGAGTVLTVTVPVDADAGDPGGDHGALPPHSGR